MRILDRLVRNELYEERDTADFRALQLHYGRLGAAWGRFIAVPDMYEAESNASVESTQSLLRLQDDSELGFAATSWQACLWLWLNKGQLATDMAVKILKGLLKDFQDDHWDKVQPRTDEEVVDAWLSAAQVCFLNSSSQMITVAVGTATAALHRARRSGDVVRTARVVAFIVLAFAQTTEDVPALLAQ